MISLLLKGVYTHGEQVGVDWMCVNFLSTQEITV